MKLQIKKRSDVLLINKLITNTPCICPYTYSR